MISKNPKHFENLFNAILNLENIQECQMFFEDICTINELSAMTQRLEVAMLLRSGKTYIEIAKETGASTATISRVNRCLNYGANGYETVLNKMDGITPINKEVEN